jgi:glycosyltransferase involved in cell wall biosynthesis
MSGWAAREGAGDLAVPVVHTYHALGLTKRRHQGGSDTSPGAREPVERMLAQRCERIVATSHEEMFELVRLGSQPQRLSLVPCGVDHQHFDETCDRSAWDHVWSRSRRVLVVSRLVERKGIDDVVTALAAVPDAELLIAGGPERCRLDGEPEAQRLLAVARRHGVEDRVRLLGRVDRADLPTLYRSADVVVCTPWYEPFGLVALEAMACGVPVVASAVGGLVDTVLDGVTGILVPPHRPDVIAHAVTGLLDAPAQRARFGSAGAARARLRYGWPTIATETVRAYERARAQLSSIRLEVG